MFSSKQLFERRRARNRTALKRVSSGQVRLSVHRSSKHIYAQVIDDLSGRTLASASTVEKGQKADNGGNCAAATSVGKSLADRAREAGIERVVFDRNGYRYHGRVRAVADGARENGLKL